MYVFYTHNEKVIKKRDYMDENTWRLAQIGMWLIGLQTTIIIAIFGAMWASFNRKFDLIDKKFEQIERRFEQVERRFEQVEKRFEKMEARFDKIDARFEKIEITINDIDKRVFAIETMFHMKDCCVLKSDSQLKKAE